MRFFYLLTTLTEVEQIFQVKLIYFVDIQLFCRLAPGVGVEE